MIGTALKGEGGTSPFVGTPFAMTKFMPQTRENKMGTMAYVYHGIFGIPPTDRMDGRLRLRLFDAANRRKNKSIARR